jgi:hypothetical protein
MDMLEQAWNAYRRSPGEAAFEPFYERSKTLVYTICRRILGDPDDAADAFQGTYGRLLVLAREPEGAAVDTRVLTPPPRPGRENQLFFSGADFMHRNMFIVFGLDRGDYEITAEAEGYHPVTVHRRITPGALIDPLDLNLQRRESVTRLSLDHPDPFAKGLNCLKP